MAKKFDGSTALRYLFYGAGAVIAPVAVTSVWAGVTTLPVLSYAFQGITVAEVVLAGAGAGLVDFFGYNK